MSGVRSGAGGSTPSDAELAPRALMAAAAAQVGHDAWGDQSFLAPLELLTGAALASGRLTGTGRRVLRSALLRHLRNRLHLQEFLGRHPPAARAPLHQPIVITGLPRTGTTVLHNLLALDRRNRFLRLWEALHPIPPEAAREPDEAELVRQAETWLERFYAIAPAMREIHPLSPSGPEECDALLQNAFASQHFDDMFDAEGYSRWFYAERLEVEYDYYALQLRVLAAHGPEHERWVLKSPGHLAHLDELLRALPAARIVHCHRDPAQSVPSYADLILNVRRPNVECLTKESAGRQALERSAASAARALAAREQIDPERLLDVSFPDLVRDPLATVARLYEWIGVSLPPELEASMRRWLKHSTRHRYGQHRLDPSHFDLPPARARAPFAAYLERFGRLCEERPAARPARGGVGSRGPAAGRRRR
jgi:hypothetical protein